jgi:hypothetical protein
MSKSSRPPSGIGGKFIRRCSMNKSDKYSDDGLIQDGISCPKDPPWPSWVSKITAVPFILLFVIVVIFLSQINVVKLIVWLLAFGILLGPMRYLVCARCIYYGKDCASILGRLVPLAFKKQEGKSMRAGMWLEVAFLFFLFLLPLPDFYDYLGWSLIVLWFGAFLLAFIVLTGLACLSCPLLFCPIGMGGRRFWSFLGKTKN